MEIDGSITNNLTSAIRSARRLRGHPIHGGSVLAQKESKWRNAVADKQTQWDKFKEDAREHEADEGEARWEERLKKIAKSSAQRCYQAAESEAETTEQVAKSRDRVARSTKVLNP